MRQNLLVVLPCPSSNGRRQSGRTSASSIAVVAAEQVLLAHKQWSGSLSRSVWFVAVVTVGRVWSCQDGSSSFAKCLLTAVSSS